MFCPKCGTQNTDGNAFCASCGATLGQVQQPNVNQQPQQFGGMPQQPQQFGGMPQQQIPPQQYGAPVQSNNPFTALINDIKESLNTPGGLVALIMSRWNVAAIASAIFMFIGLFPNFMTMQVYGIKVGAALIEGGDGVIVLISTILCIAFAVFGMHIGSLVTACINLLVILIDVSGDSAKYMDAGAGFILLMFGSLITIGVSIWGIIAKKQGKKLPLQK